MSYLEQNDFTGKVVAPFWTYNNNEGGYEEDVRSQIRNGDLAFWTPGDLFAMYFDEPEDDPEGLMILGRITTDLSVFDNLGSPEEVSVELVN